MRTRIAALFLVLAATATSTAHAQNPSHEQVYRQAMSYGDLATAAHAMHYRMAADPDNLDLKDTLAALYFTQGAFAQTLAVLEELLEARPKDARLLETKALSLRQVGQIKEALSTYEDLNRAAPSLANTYQIATLQYQLQRFGECRSTLNAIINAQDTASTQVSLNVGQQQMRVDVKAAAYNVLGVMMLDQKELAAAKQAFNKALEVEPNFVLPANNLKAMEQAAKEAEGTPKPGTGK